MPQDLLLTSFAPTITGGDFVVGESTRQHQELLLLIEKGELRQYPLSGVGIRSQLLDENPAAVRAEIKRQFELDGMKVLEVSGSGLTIKTEAIYED
jgi:hypothetical protein